MSRFDTPGVRDAAFTAAVCFVLLFVILPYYSYSAVLLLIQGEWGMSSTQAGFVFGATQVGYVAAILLVMPLTDRIRTSYILLGSAALAVVGNALFALLASEVVSGSFFRALGGAGLAGTYMPGVRLISERFPSARRGAPMGVYLAFFVLGGAVSFGGTAALVPHLGWRGAYMATSLAGIGAVVLAALLARAEGAAPRAVASSARARIPISSVLRSKPILLVITAYTGHTWELFGMRAWQAPFIATVLVGMGDDAVSASAQAGFLTSAVVVLGTLGTTVSGGLSDRLGRTATAAAILTTSATCSLVVGWLVGAPFWLVFAVCALYGMCVNPDSPMYNLAMTELAPRERLGVAMAFQSTAGWTAGIIAPVTFGLILDVVPGGAAWGVGFGSLGLGALIGVAALLALRRQPESLLLAGGKR